MNTSPIFRWSSSILMLVLTFSSVLISAIPTPGTENHEDSPRAVFFPHYIIPVYQQSPTLASNSMYTADIRYSSPSAKNEIIVYVGFDISDVAGATKYQIKFELPTKESDPYGYPWTVTGTGKIDVYPLKSLIVEGQTSWNKKPARASASPAFTITQPLGGGKAIVTGSAMQLKSGRMDFELSVPHSGAASFNWFELDNPVSGITLVAY